MDWLITVHPLEPTTQTVGTKDRIKLKFTL